MSREEILSRLTGVIQEIICDDSVEITEESSLVDELGLDSLEAMELMMEVENEFDVTIPESEIGNFSKVKDFIDYLEQNHVGE
ncbi:MAG: phosphopantetheine-binding protein [Lachnospiraceae bacterium]|nr:phosphopantetheine-binding protein [Lachnospiraceae bacterium]